MWDRRLGLAVLSAVTLSACSISTPGPTPDDTSDTVDTADSTERSPDTYEPNTFDTDDLPAEDSDDPFHQDTHTNPPGPAGCLFGEIEDCNGGCFPSYLIGDRFCDDGSVLPPNFNCELFEFDQGDCEPEDTSLPASQTCDYIIAVYGGTYPNEVGWELLNSQAAVIAGSPTGAYAGSYGVTFRTGIHLADGDYIIHAIDSWGDGWNGATWTLLDAQTGRTVYSPPATGSGWSSKAWPFHASCERVACDLDLTIAPARDAADMGWEIRSTADTVVTGRRVGTYTGVTGPITERIRLFEGSYTLRARALSTQGWKGGLIEAREPAGWLLNALSIAPGATTDIVNLPFTCETASLPPIETQVPLVAPSSCTGLSLVARTLGHASDVGFELLFIPEWRRQLTVSAGTLLDNQNRVYTLSALQRGRYLLRMSDTTGDGWNGSTLALQDADGQVFYQATLPKSSLGARYFDLNCPANTDDTDLPTTCLPGAEPDCRGICMPSVFLGDGSCDAGTGNSPDFNCEAFAYDRGDCLQPPEPDYAEDSAAVP